MTSLLRRAALAAALVPVFATTAAVAAPVPCDGKQICAGVSGGVGDAPRAGGEAASPETAKFGSGSIANPRRALAFSAPDGYILTIDPAGNGIARRHGATAVDAELGIWLVEGAARAERLRSELLGKRLLIDVEANRRTGLLATAVAEPLETENQYVDRVLGSVGLTPPVPGVTSLLVIDTGVDLTHEEFATGTVVAANPQVVDPASEGAWHGTAVISSASAPRNGVGIAGVYPGLPSAMWDGGVGGVLLSEELAAFKWARANGVRVLNMSYGGPQRSAAQWLGLMRLAGSGTLLVAAAGNEAQEGNPTSYPAQYSHVLSVAATDVNDTVSAFSQRKLSNDLSAPGVSVAAAVPAAFGLFNSPANQLPKGRNRCTADSLYCLVDGTSFSSPVASAAAAWVWAHADEVGVSLTAEQVASILRRTARDVGAAGFDLETGFGVISIGAAVSEVDQIAAGTLAAPARDRTEPDDDVPLVDGKIFGAPDPFVLPRGKRSASFSSVMDQTEDYDDVYRVFVPKRGRLEIRLKPTGKGNVNLCIWPANVSSVGLVAKPKTKPVRCSNRPGRTVEIIRFRNTTRFTTFYVDAYLPSKGAGSWPFRYSISARRLAG